MPQKIQVEKRLKTFFVVSLGVLCPIAVKSVGAPILLVLRGQLIVTCTVTSPVYRNTGLKKEFSENLILVPSTSTLLGVVLSIATKPSASIKEAFDATVSQELQWCSFRKTLL